MGSKSRRKKQESLFQYETTNDAPVANEIVTPEPVKTHYSKSEESIEQIFGVKPMGVHEELKTKKATHWWGQSNKSKR